MVICISPAKTFSKTCVEPKTEPLFKKEAKSLMNQLKRLDIPMLMSTMQISEKIAQDVQSFSSSFGKSLCAAIHLYDGQAFKGLDPSSLLMDELDLLNKHLYIMSGLYGLVRPLDGISKYRLEMKSRSFMNLEHFWKPKIHHYMKLHHHDDIIFNLASEEYGKLLIGLKNVHTIRLEIQQDGKPVMDNMAIKKARGMMARHLILNHIETIHDLESIIMDGFSYQTNLSTPDISYFIKTIEQKNVTSK